MTHTHTQNSAAHSHRALRRKEIDSFWNVLNLTIWVVAGVKGTSLRSQCRQACTCDLPCVFIHLICRRRSRLSPKLLLTVSLIKGPLSSGTCIHFRWKTNNTKRTTDVCGFMRYKYIFSQFEIQKSLLECLKTHCGYRHTLITRV